MINLLKSSSLFLFLFPCVVNAGTLVIPSKLYFNYAINRATANGSNSTGTARQPIATNTYSSGFGTNTVVAPATYKQGDGALTYAETTTDTYSKTIITSGGKVESRFSLSGHAQSNHSANWTQAKSSVKNVATTPSNRIEGSDGVYRVHYKVTFYSRKPDGPVTQTPIKTYMALKGYNHSTLSDLTLTLYNNTFYIDGVIYDDEGEMQEVEWSTSLSSFTKVYNVYVDVDDYEAYEVYTGINHTISETSSVLLDSGVWCEAYTGEIETVGTYTGKVSVVYMGNEKIE